MNLSTAGNDDYDEASVCATWNGDIDETELIVEFQFLSLEEQVPFDWPDDEHDTADVDEDNAVDDDEEDEFPYDEIASNKLIIVYETPTAGTRHAFIFPELQRYEDEDGLLSSLSNLSLRYNTIRVNIPSEVFNSCELSGSLSNNMEMLRMTSYVSLESNSIPGTIPSELGLLENC